MTSIHSLRRSFTALSLVLGIAANADAAIHNEVGASPIFNGGAGPETVGYGVDEIRGSISGGDNGDLFKLEFSTGGTLSILARKRPGALDPSLFLFDSTGAGLRADDNSGIQRFDARIVLTITPGTYYLGIGDTPLRATDLDGTTWDATNVIDAPPPSAFGVLSRLDNTGTVVSPGNYRITLSIPTTVPEPATVGMLSLGLIGLGLALRRRA